MTALSIQPTYPIFTENDGSPLESGYIWIGTTNTNPETNPISVFFDAALTIPAAQPIRTIGGYPSNSGHPARLYVNSDYSIRVQDKNRVELYSAPVSTERYSVVISGATQSVADAAALRTSTPVAGTSVIVLSSDGGLFIAKTGAAPGTYTDNGGVYCGTQVIPTGGDGSAGWVRANTEIINVIQFGSDPTGVGSSTSAFTNATAVGRPFVPPGTYDITGTVSGVFYSFGGVTITTGSVESIIDLSTLGSNFKYNDGVNFIRSLRAGEFKLQGGVDCKGDAFFDTSGINGASVNVNHDSRGAYVPTRQYSVSVASEGMDSLASWTQIKIDTGNVQVVADPSTDPAIGNVYQFTTGANLNSIGGAQKDVGSIPASYGIQFLVRLNAVGSDPDDALYIDVGNANGYNLKLRLYNGNVEVFIDGAYTTLYTHGGDYWTEWWIEVNQTSGALHNIGIYGGTQLLVAVNGNMPGSATDGLVVFQQKSGVTANRESRIALLNVGSTQRADNILLRSNIYPTRFSPTSARIVFTIEDTSIFLDVNNNLTLQFSQNGGAAWEDVTMEKVDLFSQGGPIDSSKKVWILIAEHTFTNIGASQLIWKLESTGRWWFAVTGAYMEWL